MIAEILPSLPADDYHADQVAADRVTLSASIARILLAESPAHARAAHPRLNPDWVPTHDEKFDVGTAAHALLLEGEAAVAVIEAADWRTAIAKEQREEARAAGQIPLLSKHWAAVEQMVNAVKLQIAELEVDPPLFTDGKPEQTLLWEHKGAVACRARLDWLRDDRTAIDDLKTTSRSANPETWAKTIFSLGYDVQAAFYRRAVKAITGIEPEFRLLVIETSAPYALCAMSLAPDAMAIADKKVDYALKLWARCLRDDNWPAYDLRVHHIEMPPWAEGQWLERELRQAA